MKTYIVEYTSEPLDYMVDDVIGALEYFRCQADDEAHAAEQCRDAYPGCQIHDVREPDELDEVND